MSGRDRILSGTVNAMSSWREKRLLAKDDNLKPFCWTYGTGELIDELARIDEILNLSEILEQPTEVADHFGISIYFEECFIDSHDMLVLLLDRVTENWNANGQQVIQKLHRVNSKDKLPDPEKQKSYYNDLLLASYKHANNIYKHMHDSLLRMRFLYEQLKPETQALVKCCSYKLQLQNSMLAQKIVQGPSRTTKPFNFKPACGFTLDPSSKVTLEDRLADVEVQISRLQVERDLLLNKLADEEVVRDALEVCDVLRDILAQGGTIDDPTEAIEYATEIIAPQKHILERYSSNFENTLKAFPDVYPSTCSRQEAAEFLASMLDALEKDSKELSITKMKHHEFLA